MKMTRQHFEMIAEVTSAIENPDERKRTALNFTVKLHESNINFDTCRFLLACDVNDSHDRPVVENHTRTDRSLTTFDESARKENFIAP